MLTRLVLPNSVFHNTSLSNYKQLIVYVLLVTAAKLDRVASETLAKVEEKCPIITKTPTEVTLSDCCTQFIGGEGGWGGRYYKWVTSNYVSFLEGDGKHDHRLMGQLWFDGGPSSCLGGADSPCVVYLGKKLYPNSGASYPVFFFHDSTLTEMRLFSLTFVDSLVTKLLQKTFKTI